MGKILSWELLTASFKEKESLQLWEALDTVRHIKRGRGDYLLGEVRQRLKEYSHQPSVAGC